MLTLLILRILMIPQLQTLHIRDHQEDMHQEFTDYLSEKFAIRKISTHQKPLKRQIWESVCVSNARFNLLKKKDVYNCCRLLKLITEVWKNKNKENSENREVKSRKKIRYLPIGKPKI